MLMEALSIHEHPLPLSASLQTPEYVLVSSSRTWMSFTCATVRLKEEAEEELREIMARTRMRPRIRLMGGRSGIISDEDDRDGDRDRSAGDTEERGIFLRAPDEKGGKQLIRSTSHF